ncbi:MAG: efflux RND transporter periplasmic adaptor subunit [Cyanobacteria bacterium P01_A01_bin.135]
MTHVVVDEGVVNSRVVRLQTPNEGYVQAMYVQPGVLVSANQVLAEVDGSLPENDEKLLRLKQTQENERNHLEREILDLRGQLQVNTTQRASALSTLGVLKQQLADLSERDQVVQTIDVEIGQKNLQEQQAALRATMTRADAARLDYERYASLLDEGAVSQEQTAQLEMAWEVAQAETDQVQALLSASESALTAAQNGIARSNRNNLLGGMLSDQRNSLIQAIQTQESHVATITSQIVAVTQRLNQAETLLANSPSLADDIQALYETQQVKSITSPHNGVIYSIEREQGERVSDSERLITMLDCNDLWVEALVSASQAAKIDPQTAVSVQFAGHSGKLTGEIDLIQPMNAAHQGRAAQVQAINPVAPPELIGEPLTRITVRVPPPPQYTESQQFCGIGQTARLGFEKRSSPSAVAQLKPRRLMGVVPLLMQTVSF